MPQADTQTLINAACPLCHGTERTELARYPELTWVACRCGLIYKLSERTSAVDSALYGESYFTEAHDYKRRHRRRIGKSRQQILNALEYAPRGALLDIGCSVGYTLQAAADLGLEAAGTDVSEFATAECRRLGFRAATGTLQQLPFSDGEFAIVTMKHVLEHTADPRSALAEARRVLRTGGALFIAIPDARYRKAVRNPQQSNFYRPERGGSEHYVYYTPATLARLLDECGFEVKRVNPLLVQREAAPVARLGQTLFAPLRAPAQWLADALHLRKEFWLVALRR